MAFSRRAGRMAAGTGLALLATGFVVAAVIDLTIEDFFVPGTQIGDVSVQTYYPPTMCNDCHGDFDYGNDPYSTWGGSLMAQAGRDPLFFAQMTTANQDTGNAGYYCMRCHVPMAIPTGHAYQVNGSTLDARDREGVSCHFCHSMVDPIYKPGVSPPEDESILAGLDHVPSHYGNAMFVLDPTGTRRGPLQDPLEAHSMIYSPFFKSSNMCGTCHEVGNLAVSRQANGTYRYNTIGEPSPTEDPCGQFPLERTFSEWRNSAFANSGVDMGGRFGGDNLPIVSTCQDCHMPQTTGQACFFGPERKDVRRHDFAGASAQVLDLIALYTVDDPEVDQKLLADGRAKAVSMLQRAASLQLSQENSRLIARVINETGHKLPTGHIEGRRVWLNVKFIGQDGGLVGELGHYNYKTAELDEASTRIYEMHVGLSEAAAKLTGLPAGPPGHMALADTIEKDNRIPPRGFTNAAFEACGAPVVAYSYDDGQYWDDAPFTIPPGAAMAVVTVNYQNTPKHYIEELRHNNHTDDWGDVLHALWTASGKGAPIAMVSAVIQLAPVCAPDFDNDGFLTGLDFDLYVGAFEAGELTADFDGDGFVSGMDFDLFVQAYETGC